MSNRTLILSIIAIVIVSGALAAYFYWQNTKPLTMAPATTPTAQDQSASPSSIALNPTSMPSATPTPTQTPSPSSSPTPTTIAGCERDFSPSKLADNADINIQNRQVTVKVKSFGSFTVEFYPSDAPKTVENFLRLTDSGYYDCLTFHRVAKGFVIQGGDPNGNGTGGQSAYGAPFADELNPNTPSYQAGYVTGVLAMANSGPNTNGSQFFIMLADNNLPHDYTIFGKVISGMNVVSAIGQVPITPEMGPTDGMPVTPVVMQSVKITQ